MNVVSVDTPNTLSITYERDLFGMYHDWCKSFSTYLSSTISSMQIICFQDSKKCVCNFQIIVAKIDRILRLESMLIVRDTAE
ncbi:hypothetical protein HN51_056164, partial [Arachis hypogaea]